MLANEINTTLGGNFCYEYNRHYKNQSRKRNEIGINSIRGGNIVGEHVIQFFGEFETFEIKHTAYSRDIYAQGALKAACFIVTKPNGLYDMESLPMSEIEGRS